MCFDKYICQGVIRTLKKNIAHEWREINRANGILNRGQGGLLGNTTFQLRLEGSEGVSQAYDGRRTFQAENSKFKGPSGILLINDLVIQSWALIST